MKILYLSGYGLACGEMPGMSGRLLAGQWHVMRTCMFKKSVFRTVGTEFSNISFALTMLVAGHRIRLKLLRLVQNQQREEKTDKVILTYPSPSVCGVSKMDEGTGCMINRFGHQCFFTVIRMYIHFIFCTNNILKKLWYCFLQSLCMYSATTTWFYVKIVLYCP